MKAKTKTVQVDLNVFLLVEHTIEFSKKPLTYAQLCEKVKGKATKAEVRVVCEYLMEGMRLKIDRKDRLVFIGKKNPILENAKRHPELMKLLSAPPPEARRKPLLKALEEVWDLAPSMRLTQLLICAKVFPNCQHNRNAWSDWDEETTKKLLALAADFKKQGLKAKKKKK